MKKDIDRILKQALAPEEEPDRWLNQNIIHRAEEMTQMKNRKTSRVPAAILAASITLMIGSAAVLAVDCAVSIAFGIRISSICALS